MYIYIYIGMGREKNIYKLNGIWNMKFVQLKFEIILDVQLDLVRS